MNYLISGCVYIATSLICFVLSILVKFDLIKMNLDEFLAPKDVMITNFLLYFMIFAGSPILFYFGKEYIKQYKNINKKPL